MSVQRQARNLDTIEIAELRLGEAVAGEIQKGARDADQIAANIMALYSDEWLARRILETFRKEASRQLSRVK